MGMDENKSKADSSVVGTKLDREAMKNAICERNMAGTVKLRPKILGWCIQTHRGGVGAGASAEETDMVRTCQTVGAVGWASPWFLCSLLERDGHERGC